MADVLLLTHRLPYPPSNGDKTLIPPAQTSIERHCAFVGTFIDTPEDEAYIDVHEVMLNVSEWERNMSTIDAYLPD